MNKKTVLKIMVCTALLSGLIPHTGQQQAQAQVNVSFQVFYDELSPYGSWVNYPDYGYVWAPGAGSGFRPYGTRGHWVYTEDGWTWVSDYRWGWATFHYGNWFYDDSYGWMWMPGYQWAPAWVTWGEYGGNYCWAPVGPRVDIGVSYGSYRPPFRYWNFCPREHITSSHISNYYVTNIRNTTVINNITVINNVNRGGGGHGAYLRGPQPSNVERFTHRTVRPLAIQAAPRPGAASVQGGRLAIYRPNVQNSNGSPRPANVRDLHSMKPVNGATPRPGQAVQPRPANQGMPQQQHPVQQQTVTPRPTPQQRPVPQQQSVQPRPTQQTPHPVQQTPRQMPQQQQHVQQNRPVPQQHVQQPRPQPQPRPAPQQHVQQPRTQPQQPRQQPHPAPQPQPHPAPAPRPGEHHR